MNEYYREAYAGEMVRGAWAYESENKWAVALSSIDRGRGGRLYRASHVANARFEGTNFGATCFEADNIVCVSTRNFLLLETTKGCGSLKGTSL